MILSMTGYGQAITEFERFTIKIDLRSVNGKALDINLRIPRELYHKEFLLRNEISKRVVRGSVNMNVNIEYKDVALSARKINKDLALSYLKELSQIAHMMELHKENLMQNVLQLPEVMKSINEEMSEDDFASVMQSMFTSIQNFITFRTQEGASLEKVISQSVKNISALTDEIETLEARRMASIRERLTKELTDLKDRVKVDENRFEQELIYYIERLDITEEKVRLRNHCLYFTQVMLEENCGRKLNFVSQEMGREINTMGSKANDAKIQQLVVLMKDELEKIKEQCLNIL
ncbi:MAG: YicC family protein [Bacteroidetes bacterium]|nr:YicC family protein [Bacteroidota bacterium]